MSFARAVRTVAGLTMVSRVLGFIRDVLTADLLGAGPMADAFFVAFKLPNFFRRLFAEGAFSVTFVPLFAKTAAAEGQPAAARFAEEAQAALLAILIPLTIALLLFMPAVMLVLAPGFETGSERYDLAVKLCRITFPYLTLVSITALQGGVLNALDRYGPFATAPILFNLCLIGGLLLTPLFPNAAYALSWGEFAAGVVQVIWMMGSCRRAGILLKPRWPKLTPQIKRLFTLMGPAAVGAGAVQINVFIDTMIGSLLPAGSISDLYYAERLYQLPLGVIGVAVGTALLPSLARHVRAGEKEGAKRLEARAIEASLLLSLPAAIALMVAGAPIMTALFARGHFTPEDALETAGALAGYSAGIPAYVLAKTLSTGYYAREDTKTPLKYSLITVALNTVFALSFVLIFHLGIVGISAATGITAWLNVGMLAMGLRNRGLLGFDRRLAHVLPRIVLATVMMAAALYAIQMPLHGWWSADIGRRGIGLALLVGGGLAVYGAIIVLSGAAKISDVTGLLKRERSSALTDDKGRTDNPIPPETLSSST
ncbi:MAG TPA: murein biosynthesis integral membrane protein MurJ [Alphaproteobacteria bacterium]|jgi:putative peptidoglycan lipid II flippase|nr:murein biosynthesis integral membrane protein MurJ [Alphaproteobacteria bacterium]